MVLDIATSEMNSSTPVNIWHPLDILNVKSSFRYGLVILNQPINITKETMLSLWKRVHGPQHGCMTEANVFFTGIVKNDGDIITVDGGTNRWFQFLQGADCVAPDLITGDMDSIKQNILTYFKSRGTRVVETPDQNETDFAKALKHLQTHITSENLQLDGVIAICETSGRLDQILTNLNTLYKANEIVGNLPVYQLSKNSLTWLLKPGQHRILVGDIVVQKHGWCSLVPLGAKVENVTTTGLKWNLENRSMQFGGLVSSSNTYSGSPVITVNTDGILVWSMGLCDDKDT